MPPKRKYKRHNHAAIVAFYREHRDYTTKEIAERFSVPNAETVQWVLRKAGIKIGQGNYIRREDKWYRDYIKKFHDPIVALTKSHPSMSMFAVSVEVGCALSTVCVTWQDVGWERRFKRCKECGREAEKCWEHREAKEHLPVMMLPENERWEKETVIRKRLKSKS
jgi:hypothetical protein